MENKINVRAFVQKYTMVLALAIVVIFFSIVTNGKLILPQNLSNLIAQNAYVFVLAVGMIEVYATTLHYAPCNVEDCGFRAVVVLPEGTNTEIETGHSDTPEDRLLFARNKWLIAHPDAGIEGAWNGLKGANLSID